MTEERRLKPLKLGRPDEKVGIAGRLDRRFCPRRVRRVSASGASGGPRSLTEGPVEKSVNRGAWK